MVLAGPLSLYVAGCIRRDVKRSVGRSGSGSGISGATWFWAVVLSSGELYGGYVFITLSLIVYEGSKGGRSLKGCAKGTMNRLMNFLPEWLSGCESLDTGDPVHL